MSKAQKKKNDFSVHHPFIVHLLYVLLKASVPIYCNTMENSNLTFSFFETYTISLIADRILSVVVNGLYSWGTVWAIACKDKTNYISPDAECCTFCVVESSTKSKNKHICQTPLI